MVQITIMVVFKIELIAQLLVIFVEMLEVPISDYQACLAMVEVKLARLQETPNHIDSYVDACAYLALACELSTEEDEGEYYA